MLRASGAVLTGGAAGALVSHSLDDARAAETDLSVSGDEVVVRNQTIEALWLTLGVGWAYQVPSGERPAQVTVAVLAGTDSGDLSTVATATSDQSFLESSGEESFEVDLVAEDIVTADALVPGEGGTTAETTVHVGAEMRLTDENDMVIAAASQTDTATVAIEKSAYDPSEHGSLTGTGSVTVELG